MKKLKELLTKLVKDLKEADWKNPYVVVAAVLFVSVPALIGVASFIQGKKQSNDIRNSSVMITNSRGSSGGTGIILHSHKNDSLILTNAHVCGVVKKGGTVRTANSVYQVNSYIESKLSDLCLVKVLADLGVNTEISKKDPKFYDKAIVSGHPHLMPNVITEGHYSGRRIIDVAIGFRKCTDKDLENPDTGMACVTLGSLPIIRSFESVLVTATIMPGSSGSGVYNQDQDLTSVVFAGSGDLGYAWTVPYEQVRNFLDEEIDDLDENVVSQEMSLVEASSDEDKTKIEIASRCKLAIGIVDSPLVKKICDMVQKDAMWSE